MHIFNRFLLEISYRIKATKKMCLEAIKNNNNNILFLHSLSNYNGLKNALLLAVHLILVLKRILFL